jgi:hypothetical protein
VQHATALIQAEFESSAPTVILNEYTVWACAHLTGRLKIYEFTASRKRAGATGKIGRLWQVASKINVNFG